MGIVIVALCIVVAWQHARYRRVHADVAALAGKVDALTEQVDYLDMAAHENGCMADEYVDALLQRSYICIDCGHVIPDSVPATQRVQEVGAMAGKVVYRCADCVAEYSRSDDDWCTTGDGSEEDEADDTLRELAFAECAICESTVTVAPETHGPVLCCYCRADFRDDEADGLPLPSEAEVDRLLDSANRLSDETLGPLN